MEKWFKIDKGPFGMYAAIIIFDRIAFYAGQTDHWGISFDINLYDRSMTFEILNLYAGVEIFHKK